MIEYYSLQYFEYKLKSVTQIYKMAPPQAVAVCGACFALCWFLAFWIVVIVTGTMCIKNFEEYDTFERVGID